MRLDIFFSLSPLCQFPSLEPPDLRNSGEILSALPCRLGFSLFQRVTVPVSFFFWLQARVVLVWYSPHYPHLLLSFHTVCAVWGGGGLVFLFEKEKLQTAVPPRNSSEVRKLGVWGEPWLDARTYYPCRQSPRVFPCNSAAQNACLPLWCTTASLGNGRASG